MVVTNYVVILRVIYLRTSSDHFTKAPHVCSKNNAPPVSLPEHRCLPRPPEPLATHFGTFEALVKDFRVGRF